MTGKLDELRVRVLKAVDLLETVYNEVVEVLTEAHSVLATFAAPDKVVADAVANVVTDVVGKARGLAAPTGAARPGFCDAVADGLVCHKLAGHDVVKGGVVESADAAHLFRAPDWDPTAG